LRREAEDAARDASFANSGCSRRTPYSRLEIRTHRAVHMLANRAHAACFLLRVLSDGAVLAWPLERTGKSRRVSVDGRVMVNDLDFAVRAAVEGLGIAYALEAVAEPFLRSGQLVRVLEEWSPSFEGLFLYYPAHGQVPAALRALIGMISTARGSTPTKRALQNAFTKE
jgi:DNA-binding transcriptional LysR family regulator